MAEFNPYNLLRLAKYYRFMLVVVVSLIREEDGTEEEVPQEIIPNKVEVEEPLMLEQEAQH